jgi:hypothetical protein
VGSGQVSAFFTPHHPGRTVVTVHPVIPGQKTEPIALTFEVRASRER